jgi:hypothetical protein
MLAISASAGRLPLESYISHGSEAGIQWTKVRKAVLHLLWSTAEPLGAYEAAERLSNPGKRVFPTSVYRCLDCLMEAGLVLQIVTWNKFVLPPRPGLGLGPPSCAETAARARSWTSMMSGLVSTIG